MTEIEPTRAELVARLAAEAAADRVAEQITGQIQALSDRLAKIESRPAQPNRCEDTARRLAALEERPAVPAGLAEDLTAEILANMKLAALEGNK